MSKLPIKEAKKTFGVGSSDHILFTAPHSNTGIPIFGTWNPYGSPNKGQKSVDHFKELNQYRVDNWKSIVMCRLNSNK